MKLIHKKPVTFDARTCMRVRTHIHTHNYIYIYYFLAAVRGIFQTRTAFVPMRKDVLLSHNVNSVIYKYTCSCGSYYIGRTSNRLNLRIKQHLPACILNIELKRGQLANTSGSSVAEHMIDSRECVVDFNVD